MICQVCGGGDSSMSCSCKEKKAEADTLKGPGENTSVLNAVSTSHGWRQEDTLHVID